MMLLDITTFIGHLHPLLVHLPIGFLLLAVLIDLFSYSRKFQHVIPSVSIILLLGLIAALVSSVTGYVLSLSGDYDYQRLSSHQTGGIIVTAFSGLLFALSTQPVRKKVSLNKKAYSSLSIILFVIVSYTGHLGGSLTHGSEYLSWNVLMNQKLEKPSSVEEALMYEQVIQPLLMKRCSQCHRVDKRKGKLSMQSVAALKKGGKSGPAVVAGNLSESELYKRISLDPTNEKFMPADGKPSLTKSETAIIKWWIEKGMAVDGKRLGELQYAEEIKPQVAALLGFGDMADDSSPTASGMNEINPEIPSSVNMDIVDNLRNKGMNVRIMQHHPPMLDITLPSESDAQIDLLKPDLIAIAKNVIWFNVSDNDFTEKDLDFLPQMTNLEKLRLEKNRISDAIASNLMGLKHLEVVNLNETDITQTCINQLRKMPKLNRVYHWKTQVNGSLMTDFEISPNNSGD